VPPLGPPEPCADADLGRSVQGSPITARGVRRPERRAKLVVVGCITGDEPAGIAICQAASSGLTPPAGTEPSGSSKPESGTGPAAKHRQKPTRRPQPPEGQRLHRLGRPSGGHRRVAWGRRRATAGPTLTVEAGDGALLAAAECRRWRLRPARRWWPADRRRMARLPAAAPARAGTYARG